MSSINEFAGRFRKCPFNLLVQTHCPLPDNLIARNTEDHMEISSQAISIDASCVITSQSQQQSHEKTACSADLADESRPSQARVNVEDNNLLNIDTTFESSKNCSHEEPRDKSAKRSREGEGGSGCKKRLKQSAVNLNPGRCCYVCTYKSRSWPTLQ